MIARNTILDAIVTRLQETDDLLSVRRGLKMPNEIPEGSTPCAFVVCPATSFSREHARDPGSQTIAPEIYLYVFGVEATSISERLHDVVANVEDLFRAYPGEGCAYGTTLGGNVAGAWVTSIEFDEGSLDDTKAIAVITLRVDTIGA